MYKILFLSGAIVFALPSLKAQQTVATLGGDVKGNTHTLSYTVGQVATMQARNNSHSLSEGVQQGLFVKEDHVAEANLLPCKIIISPNPSLDFIRIQSDSEDELDYVMFTTAGARVCGGSFSCSTTVSLCDMAAGVYIVKVSNKEGKERKFQIVKSK
jgi:hypothetical protein